MQNPSISRCSDLFEAGKISYSDARGHAEQRHKRPAVEHQAALQGSEEPGHQRRESSTSTSSDADAEYAAEPMNTKRWLLASVAVFVVVTVLEFLSTACSCSDLYRQHGFRVRPEARCRK